MQNNYSLGMIDLGLGGLGDELQQQVKDQDAERKKKRLNLGLERQSNAARAAGMNGINLLGNAGG